MSLSIIFPAPGYPGHCGEDGGNVAGKSSVYCVPAGGEFGGELGGESECKIYSPATVAECILLMGLSEFPRGTGAGIRR